MDRDYRLEVSKDGKVRAYDIVNRKNLTFDNLDAAYEYFDERIKNGEKEESNTV